MKLSVAQAAALEAIVCACKLKDPMSYPPKVTTDLEDPRGVCQPATARALAKRGLVEWVEGSRAISITDAGRKALNETSSLLSYTR